MNLVMPKLPTLNAKEAEKLLIAFGFELIRSKGSHLIYKKGKIRAVVPYHGKKDLHPKIVKEILEKVEYFK